MAIVRAFGAYTSYIAKSHPIALCVISCLFVPLFVCDIWVVGYCLFERLSFLTNDMYTCIPHTYPHP